MKIINHWLCEDDGSPFPQYPSPNLTNLPLEHHFIVMHYTASPDMMSAVRWLRNPIAEASAHIVIGREGEIAQLVPFNKWSWHAGESWYNYKDEEFSGLNRYSIGIELANAGRLERQAGKWMPWYKGAIDPEFVHIAKHEKGGGDFGWHTYTTEQILVATLVCVTLRETYPILDVIGHDDISYPRKVDPGPAFPMFSFRGKVMGRKDECCEGECCQ
jgi:N-acetylmuramoyl-L-alanine amidase